ncbi:MAG TPA: hypothetical protein VIY48_09535, partial [Candidatus Paceibacterota bacterium]
SKPSTPEYETGWERVFGRKNWPTLDEITPKQWREMTSMQMLDYHTYWTGQGKASFRCLTCGYPMQRGVEKCEACKDGKR